jgi:leucyl aminopeptidase
MMGALGNRYSGILGNRPSLLCKAVSVGALAGERVNVFPFDEDYDEDLESTVADIKQCTIDSEADHILAARFLYKFIDHKDDISWLHMDLSSYNRKGGLGAVSSDVNGFGVGFSFELIKTQLS